MAVHSLFRQELPWLISEVVLLIVLLNANPPELWFWLVVFLVVFGYIDRAMVVFKTWEVIRTTTPAS